MISDKLIEKECAALRRSIKKKQRFVREAPEGKLKCRKSHDSFYWYIVKPNAINTSNINNEHFIDYDNSNDCSSLNGNPAMINNILGMSSADYQEKFVPPNKDIRNTSYIKKDNRKLAERMALKGLYEQELLDEKQELKALENYLAKRSKFERSEKYLNRSEAIYELLKSRLEAKWPPEVQAWVDDITPCVDNHPENKTHRCKNGLMVSSKSEQLIANSMLDKNVPFKYEEPIRLEGQLRKPDFTILNVRTGQEFLWEHFGMMGDPGYLKDNTYKMGQYLRSGYLPFVNFITTFETGNSGVDSMWVEMIIETYLK